MKIRTSFVTNSSSTNFLIISKQELTESYLFKKLGFIENGKMAVFGHELCHDIIEGINHGLYYHDYVEPSYDSIKEVFGEKAATLYSSMKNAHAYWGNTSSEDDTPFTQFFTTDSFEIEKHDFYLNGRSCVW